MKWVIAMFAHAARLAEQNISGAFLAAVDCVTRGVTATWARLVACVPAAVSLQKLDQENIAHQAHPVVHNFVLSAISQPKAPKEKKKMETDCRLMAFWVFGERRR
jgi:hypothetical protein